MGPAVGGRFSWRGLVLWLLAGPVLGLLVAWVAVIAQGYFAPLVIFPLLVGVGLGAMTIVVMRLGQVGNRPTVMLGAVLAGLVTVAGQHYLDYRDECRRIEHQNKQNKSARDAQQTYPELLKFDLPQAPDNVVAYLQAQAEQGREMNVGGYVARGWVAWLSWAIDGLLVFAAALALVVPAMRLPYCDRCRTWYRVIRSGRIDVSTARRLAETTGVPTVDQAVSARYRLLSCNGGCGPTDFQLSWDESPGGTSSVQTWLHAECRNRMMQVLDQTKTEDDRR